MANEDFEVQFKKVLDGFSVDLQRSVNDIGLTYVKKLVKLTKSTAPVGKSEKHYKSSISYKVETNALGRKTYIWYVKLPNARLTHLLVNGHVTRNGGRTQANPFLENACNEVIPQYEKEVERAIKDAGK